MTVCILVSHPQLKSSQFITISKFPEYCLFLELNDFYIRYHTFYGCHILFLIHFICISYTSVYLRFFQEYEGCQLSREPEREDIMLAPQNFVCM